MDRVTKFLLGVIAVSLASIAAKLWQIPEAQAQGLFSGAPTLGEFRDASSPATRDALLRRLPVVHVVGNPVPR